MAIINFDFFRAGSDPVEKVPYGAYSPLDAYNSEADRARMNGASLYLWKSYEGLCISEYERNGYDDSDFHMIVWDPVEGKPKDIIFASSRGWSYPSYGSKPDASPEVMKAYAGYHDKLARRYRVQKAWEARKERNAAADAAGVSRKALRALGGKLFPVQMAAILKLLMSNVRSPFKKSLKAQVVAFLKGEGKYDLPLSPKQFACLVNSYEPRRRY